ncbi:MAG: hypothetical protein U1D30_06545 [Planctomycetota bacterium]
MGDEQDNSPNTSSSPWVSSSGRVANPNAPLGCGGPGRFRSPSSLGSDENGLDPIHHPDSPVGRKLIPGTDEKQRLIEDGVPFDQSKELDVKTIEETPANAPPATQPTSFKITKKAGNVDIDVEVKLVADGKDNKAGREWNAKCQMDPSKIKHSYPQVMLDDNNIVTDIVGSAFIKGTVTIQVLYGANAKPTARAAYGRGTTPDDIKNGDVTVGFHESKHVADFINWFKTKDFPAFTGKKGMTETKFNEVGDAWEAAVLKYFEDAETDTKKKTDEVGSTTLSDYQKKHPGFEH